jgi:hypothetical protein
MKTKLTKKELLDLIENTEKKAWELFKAMEDCETPETAADCFRAAWCSLYKLKCVAEAR